MVGRNCNAADPLTAPRHSPRRSHRAKHRNSVADFCAGASPGQPEAPPQTPPRGSAPLGTSPGPNGPESGRFAPRRVRCGIRSSHFNIVSGPLNTVSRFRVFGLVARKLRVLFGNCTDISRAFMLQRHMPRFLPLCRRFAGKNGYFRYFRNSLFEKRLFRNYITKRIFATKTTVFISGGNQDGGKTPESAR